MCKDNWLSPQDEMNEALADLGEEPPHSKIHKVVITKESLEKLWNILFSKKGDTCGNSRSDKNIK